VRPSSENLLLCGIKGCEKQILIADALGMTMGFLTTR
jgi:hypothetical protein